MSNKKRHGLQGRSCDSYDCGSSCAGGTQSRRPPLFDTLVRGSLGGDPMHRPLLLALLALLGVSLVPLAVAGASPSPGSDPATVTATGVAFIPPPADPVSVSAVQVMGPFDS